VIERGEYPLEARCQRLAAGKRSEVADLDAQGEPEDVVHDVRVPRGTRQLVDAIFPDGGPFERREPHRIQECRGGDQAAGFIRGLGYPLDRIIERRGPRRVVDVSGPRLQEELIDDRQLASPDAPKGGLSEDDVGTGSPSASDRS
jgi:hypothetical protein